MSDTMKLSFCVPLYNRADSVTTCVESLIAQTLPADQYEIIVVDDGSTDGGGESVERLFAIRRFANGRVVRLDDNSGGASTPRNVAVGLARGDLLFFVDSDDYVCPDLAERVCDYAQWHGSDVIYVKYGQVGEGLVPAKGFAEHGDLPQADIIKDKLLYATMVHKGFRRSEWLRLGLAFDPMVQVYEDMLVTVRFLVGTVVHSILADKEYYWFVNRATDRLHAASQPLTTTFQVYAATIDAIINSCLDEPYRMEAAAIIVNRVMRHGPAACHPYLDRHCPASETTGWMALWRDLLAHLPIAADRFVSPDLRNQVTALRRGNVTMTRWAVWIEGLSGTNRTLSRLLRRVYRGLVGWCWRTKPNPR